MPRPVILFTNGWADLPLEELAGKAAEWGYQGLELCCWGDHFEVQRALSEDDYFPAKLDLLARHDLQVPVLSNHRVGQAVCDPIDHRHQRPAARLRLGRRRPGGRAAAGRRGDGRHGPGRPEARRRASSAASPARRCGPTSPATRRRRPRSSRTGFQRLRQAAGHPILDVCRECGVRFAFEVHPGQIAFDLYTRRDGPRRPGRPGGVRLHVRPEPPALAGGRPGRVRPPLPGPHLPRPRQGRGADAQRPRRAARLATCPSGDPRRGWQFRCPGHGGIDWEGVIRASTTPATTARWRWSSMTAGMDPDYGAARGVQVRQAARLRPGRAARRARVQVRSGHAQIRLGLGRGTEARSGPTGW